MERLQSHLVLFHFFRILRSLLVAPSSEGDLESVGSLGCKRMTPVVTDSHRWVSVYPEASPTPLVYPRACVSVQQL